MFSSLHCKDNYSLMITTGFITQQFHLMLLAYHYYNQSSYFLQLPQPSHSQYSDSTKSKTHYTGVKLMQRPILVNKCTHLSDIIIIITNTTVIFRTCWTRWQTMIIISRSEIYKLRNNTVLLRCNFTLARASHASASKIYASNQAKLNPLS